MKVFPYTLIRIGGMPYDNMLLLNLKYDYSLEEDYQKIKTLRNELSDSIYRIISESRDKKEQNSLLNLRRDIFNGKSILISELSNVLESLTVTSRYQLEEYLSLSRNFNEAIDRIKVQYEDDFGRLRECLKDLAASESIQNGLVFSSHSLYKNVSNYLNYSGEYTKDIKKTEVSLIKYLSRTMTKTSPFSSFNCLAVAKLSDNSNGEFLIYPSGNSIAKESKIRLNNSIYTYLRNCLSKLRALYTNFNIILNPTITKESSNYRYIINFNNLESFQRIEITPLLEYVYDVLNVEKRIEFSGLIKLIIVEDVVEAKPEDIEKYIYKLIELGFIEYDIGISGLDFDWIKKLNQLLYSFNYDNEVKAKIIDTLDYLSAKARVMENSTYYERYNIMQKSFEKISELSNWLDFVINPETGAVIASNNENKLPNKVEDNTTEKEDTDNFISKNINYLKFEPKPESLFYEDTIIKDTLSIDSKVCTDLIYNINKLLGYFEIFEGHKDEMEKMTQYFKKIHSSTDKVNLLSFYEEYIGYKKDLLKNREKKKGNLQDKDLEAKTPGQKITAEGDNIIIEEEVPETKARRELQNIWLNFFTDRIKSLNYTCNDEIKLNDEIFRDSFENAKLDYNPNIESSMGYFLQYYIDCSNDGESQVKAVMNSSFSGYGKMVSRFLNLFPADFTKELQTWNERYSNDNILAENIDAGIMNYNMHPPLMPYEISIPGGNYVHNKNRRVPISHLEISLNKALDGLELSDKISSKRVYAFDLGFQGYGGRSELFKFLESFTLYKSLSVQALTRKIQNMFGPVKMTYEHTADEVVIRPRISYNNKIILSRKEWIIPSKLLPFRFRNEKESEYFARLQKWRIEFGLSNETFYHIRPLYFENDAEHKGKKNFTRDDYKPQYLNFCNPFLVRLFEKQIGKVVQSMKFVEMLPTSDDLLKVNSKKYVMEFVNQTYNY